MSPEEEIEFQAYKQQYLKDPESIKSHDESMISQILTASSEDIDTKGMTYERKGGHYLTAKEVKYATQKGYLYGKNVAGEAFDKLKREMTAHIEDFYQENSAFNNMINNQWVLPALVLFLDKHYSVIVEPASSLLGSEPSSIILFPQIFNIKPGFAGTPFHSDLWPLRSTLGLERSINFMIAISEIKEDGSPLMLVEGTHRYIPSLDERFQACVEIPDKADIGTVLKARFILNKRYSSSEAATTALRLKHYNQEHYRFPVGSLAVKAVQLISTCYAVKNYSDRPISYFRMEEADTLWFHPHLLHGSNIISTRKEPRVGLSLRIISIEDEENFSLAGAINTVAVKNMPESMMPDNLKEFLKTTVLLKDLLDVLPHSQVLSADEITATLFPGENIRLDDRLYLPVTVRSDVKAPFVSMKNLKALHCKAGYISPQDCAYDDGIGATP